MHFNVTNKFLCVHSKKNNIAHRHIVQVLSFGRPPRALYLMSVKGAGGGAAAWQPHAANGGAAAESQMPPPGAVPILAAVFDAAVHIRTLGKRTRTLSMCIDAGVLCR
jgi:hypothetical protein